MDSMLPVLVLVTSEYVEQDDSTRVAGNTDVIKEHNTTRIV